MHKFLNIMMTTMLIIIAVCSIMAVIDNPGLWPLAAGVLLLTFVELKAYVINLRALWQKSRNSRVN